MTCVVVQVRVVALESALPPLRVAAKRLRFTPKRSKAKSAAGGLESQLLADIAFEGAVSCSTDVTADAGVYMERWSVLLVCWF